MGDWPSPILEVDLADDGAFATDISQFVYDVAVEWGRRSPLEKVSPRKATVVLDNTDERFTPKNTSGPYSPDWRKDKPIRLKAKVPAIGGTNLIDNPSSETDITGWTAIVGDALSRSIDEAKYGGASVLQNATAASPQFLILTQRSGSRFSVTAGLDYVFRTNIRIKAGNVLSGWKIEIEWLDGGGSTISVTASAFVLLSTDSPWTEFIVAGTAPALAVTAQLRVQEDTANPLDSGSVHLDGHFFYQSSDTTVPYIDGDQPGATWSGTAHESTSSRGTDPVFAEILGFITDLKVERRRGDHVCTVAITGLSDYHLDRFVSQHNIEGLGAAHTFERLLDIVEGTELFENPNFEQQIAKDDTVLPTQYTKVGPHAGTSTLVVETDSDAFDGDHELRYGVSAGVDAGDGWRYDMTSVTTAGKEYRFVILLKNPSTDNVGETILFRMVDDLGGEAVQATVTVTLGNQDVWVYAVVKGTYRSGSTARYVEFVAETDFAVSRSDSWRTDAHHGVLAADEIKRDFRGLATTTLAHVAAYQRSARAFLDELADSVGGVVWAQGDGTITLEDYQTRAAAPIPKLRLTDSVELDGLGVSGVAYAEKQDHSYTKVLVYSDGEIIAIGAPTAILWEAEPLPVLGNNEVRVYHVAYPVAETGGQIIGRREYPEFPTATGSATALLVPSGVGGILTITAGGSGATFTTLRIKGILRQRQSSRSRVSYVPSGAAARRFQRELRLDMPMQGSATSVMDTIAQRAGDNFLEGQDVIEATLAAVRTEQWLEALGRDFGDPVHIRHNTGPGNLALNDVYQIEGAQLRWASRPRHKLSVTWTLSRASIQLLTTRRAPAENAEARQFARAAPSRRQAVT
jgi:hypothetical protein